LLYTNDIVTDYDEFLSSHQQYYATEIQYQVEYDEETFLEQGEKIAGRVFITTTRPNEPAKRIEVILIAQYKDEKIYRLWELTYPDWSKLPAFSNQLT
ncbi:TPA: nuclear transport factor 2 family protein, partial [Legionella pneumophila]